LLGTSAGATEVNYLKERGGYRVLVSDVFDAAPGGELTMSGLIGDLKIIGSVEPRVQITQNFWFDVQNEAEAARMLERYRADVRQIGKRIEVTGASGGTFRNGYNVNFDVKVPEKFDVKAATTGGDILLRQVEGEVAVNTAGGDITAEAVSGNLKGNTAGGDITGHNLSGTVSLSTAGGDVKLSYGLVGPFTLKTSGGDIEIQAIHGNVDGSTSGGDMEAHDVTGNVNLRTSGGDITLVDVHGTSHDVSTSGGDIDVRDVSGDVRAKTSGGNLSVNRVMGNFQGNTSGGDINVSEVGGDVDVLTSGGFLDLSAIAGRMIGKTSGGDVRARVVMGGKLSGPINLMTSGGEIELLLPPDLQASVEARIRVTDIFSDYDVHSDFNLKISEGEVEGRKGRRAFEVTAVGDLNGGGPLIELETVNGDISIEKVR
jgi:DUF4097 and DUF4098 domain-containing protein YvlB